MNVFGLFHVVFHAPEHLWLAWATVPLFLVFGYLFIKPMANMRRSPFVGEYLNSREVQSVKQIGVLLTFLCMTTMLAAVEWADPELITDAPVVQYGGVRIAYIVDTSISTEALDVNLGGTPISRIKAMQKFLFEMEMSLRGEGGRGAVYAQTVIPFAGKANTFGGFSVSSTYIHELIAAISTSMISTPGTNIVDALQKYNRTLELYPSEKDDVDIVFILSDGIRETGKLSVTEPAAVYDVLRAIHPRATVYSVAFGGNTPTHIPEYLPSGKFLKWKTMEGVNGQPGPEYTSAFGEVLMQSLVNQGGECIRIGKPDPDPDPSDADAAQLQTRCVEISSIATAVTRLKKNILDHRTLLPPTTVEKQLVPAAPWFCGVGLFFLTLMLLIEWLKKKLLRPDRRSMHEVLFSHPTE